MLGDVVIHLLLMPRDDRVDLHHLPSSVPLNWAGVAALHGLVPPQPGDPCVVAAKGAFHRPRLPVPQSPRPLPAPSRNQRCAHRPGH
jgi:hypothetical protein